MSDLVPAKRLARDKFHSCPHCGHCHPSAESVRLCGLFKRGWVFVDVDGYLCNGPYTRPEGDGSPRQPVRLIKKSCRSCKHSSLSPDGAIICNGWGMSDAPGQREPILTALSYCTEARIYWKSRAPLGPLMLQVTLPLGEEVG